jgi:enamine deaminase RidA (YjgF/YER057c/UK114 family)
MTRQVISSGGPLEQIHGYSRAVRVGAHVHIAGTAARGEALAGDAYVQTQNILGTIRSALERAGARVEDVVRTVIYPTDTDDAESVGRAHREVFGDVRPTRRRDRTALAPHVRRAKLSQASWASELIDGFIIARPCNGAVRLILSADETPRIPSPSSGQSACAVAYPRHRRVFHTQHPARKESVQYLSQVRPAWLRAHNKVGA